MITDEEIDVTASRFGMWVAPGEKLREFARLIEQRAREEEREACAKIAEEECNKTDQLHYRAGCAYVLRRIRTRGES